MDIQKVLSAWIEVEGIAVEQYANPEGVRLNLANGTITMDFAANTAELDAIEQGRAFVVEKDLVVVSLFSATPSSNTGQLLEVNGSSGWLMDAQNPHSTEAIAYRLTNTATGEGVGLTIVNPGAEAKGFDQLAITAGGIVQVSPNLIGKQVRVRCPVCYPKSVNVVIKKTPLEKVTAHCIVETKQGYQIYVGIKGCLNIPKTPNLKAKIRTVNLSFAPTDVQIENLSPQI